MQQPITRVMTIDMGHRIPKHESKCRNAHGHTYKIEVTIDGMLHGSGAQEGMVLDFGFLKNIMSEVLERRFDHVFCAYVGDEAILRAFYPQSYVDGFDNWLVDIQTSLANYGWVRMSDGPIGTVVVLPYVPTAENLALHWFSELSELLQQRHSVKLIGVKVWETPNCFAECKI